MVHVNATSDRHIVVVRRFAAALYLPFPRSPSPGAPLPNSSGHLNERTNSAARVVNVTGANGIVCAVTSLNWTRWMQTSFRLPAIMAREQSLLRIYADLITLYAMPRTPHTTDLFASSSEASLFPCFISISRLLCSRCLRNVVHSAAHGLDVCCCECRCAVWCSINFVRLFIASVPFRYYYYVQFHVYHIPGTHPAAHLTHTHSPDIIHGFQAFTSLPLDTLFLWGFHVREGGLILFNHIIWPSSALPTHNSDEIWT